MMPSSMWRASCLVSSPHHAWSAIWRHPIALPRTVAMSHEWSIGLVLHCSHMFARLEGHDGAPARTSCRS
jgi:hypothetical protein